MLTDPSDIEDYLRNKLGLTNEYKLNEKGEVDIAGLVAITYKEPLQVQFGRVEGHFALTLEDNCSDLPVPSFQGFPHHVSQCFSLFRSGFKDMSGIEKVVKFVGEDIVLEPDAIHVLGIAAIGGHGKIDFDRGAADKIFNEHRISHDVLTVQDALLDAGLTNLARF